MKFNLHSIPISLTGQFSKLVLDYFNNHEDLKSLHAGSFTSVNIRNFIKQNGFDHINREVLVKELLAQYKGINTSAETQQNIQALSKQNTFTITTGHQLCLFTGPLYLIYKIISVITQCAAYNKEFPEFKFIPVFWMASEDHDEEEINHVQVSGKKLKWDSLQKGKVGDFKTDGIATVINELELVLGNAPFKNELLKLLRSAYESENLSEAFRKLINELFGKYGLVIINPDSEAFKKLFRSEMKREIETQLVFNSIEPTNHYLGQLGYKPQVNPRELNLFYTDHQLRERIIKSQDKFVINGTSLSFSIDELLELVENKPEVFSPNVLMRPLFQQKILPNIVYVGGPGEVAYWLQYKAMFDAFSLPFPVIQPRKFALLLEPKISSKLHKLNLNIEDVFLHLHELEKKVIPTDSINLDEVKQSILKSFLEIKEKIKNIDPTLIASTDAELQKTNKGIEQLEQKTIRALKQKNDLRIAQVRAIKNALFPEGIIQERIESCLYYLAWDNEFIDALKESFEAIMASEVCYLGIIISNKNQ